MEASETKSRPCVVYLDTSDWSYLEQGENSAVERELRTFALDGRAVYLVSYDHLVELAGLENGLRRRIEFLRTFPGVQWLEASGSAVLRHEARMLLSHCTGTVAPNYSIPFKPISSFSHEEIRSSVRTAAMLRRVMGLKASAMATSPRESKDRQRIQQKVLSHAKQGSRGAVLDLIRKENIPLGLLRHAQPVAAAAITGILRLAVRLDLISALPKFDEHFEWRVAMSLPLAVRRCPATLQDLNKAWNDERLLAALTPSLACVKNLERKMAPPTRADEVRSFELDKMHAAMAPCVDVFTCDRRNIRIIRDSISASNRATRVINTRRLAEIVVAVREHTGGH